MRLAGAPLPGTPALACRFGSFVPGLGPLNRGGLTFAGLGELLFPPGFPVFLLVGSKWILSCTPKFE
jgi:hypothetical protein